MKTEILNLFEGAEKAKGTGVIIDVFRAFTVEAYLYENGAVCTVPVGSVEEARRIKEEHPDWILCGERHGKKLPGFDLGNSPAEAVRTNVKGKTVIHTTSAGVQGIVKASGCDTIVTGALVNASAVARYLQQKNPDTISLVAMGLEGLKETEEDLLCAEYIRSVLEGHPLPDIEKLADDLRYTEGKKFFDPAKNDIFPREDFDLCTQVDRMNFVILVHKKGNYFVTEKIDV